MNGLKTDTIINRDALYALRELPEERDRKSTRLNSSHNA